MSESPEGSLGARVLRGIEAFVLGHAAQLAAAFFVTPILTSRLGSEGYALYALIGLLQGYLMLLNLGTGNGVQRYAADLKRRPGRLAAILRTAFAVELGMGLVASAALFFCRDWLAGTYLQVQGQPLALVAAVLGWTAAIAPCAFVFNFATNALYGLERLAAFNAFQAALAVGTLVASAAVLTAGRGIHAVAASIWAIYAVLAAGSAWAVRRELAVAPAAEPRDRPEFMQYSLKTLASQLLWLVANQGDRLVVGWALPLSQLGYYSACGQLAQKLNVFLGAISGASFPVLTDLQAQGDHARVKRLYLKLTELTWLAVLPVSILVFLAAPQFLGLWLGPEFGRPMVWPLRFLVIANVGYIGSFMPQYVALSRGAAGLHARVYAAKVVALAVLWPLLTPRLGIKGVALAVAVAEWLVTPGYVWALHRRYVHVGVAEYWTEACWRPVAAAAFLSALLLPTHHLFSGWASLVLGSAAALGVYGAFAYWLLDEPAKKVLHDWVRAKLKSR
ncbi:MAG: oligosaccharide flippase family protein [Elusimicrobia bacterium]|nr:oligosaccharide flippase family protein [Elusimicrobiota bacterium]